MKNLYKFAIVFDVLLVIGLYVWWRQRCTKETFEPTDGGWLKTRVRLYGGTPARSNVMSSSGANLHLLGGSGASFNNMLLNPVAVPSAVFEKMKFSVVELKTPYLRRPIYGVIVDDIRPSTTAATIDGAMLVDVHNVGSIFHGEGALPAQMKVIGKADPTTLPSHVFASYLRRHDDPDWVRSHPERSV